VATLLQRPPEAEPPPTDPPPGQRVQAVRARAHFEHIAEEIPPPGRLQSLALFLIAGAVYFVLGYQTVIEHGVVVFDALDRLTRAYMVWHNDPSKLAAVGFVFPPLTTMVFLPFTIIKPLATSLVALPLVSSIFGAWMIVAMNRLLARCSMPGLQRWLLLALFGLNPLLIFYAGNGMGEVVYLALLTFALYCFTSWFLTAQPRFLVIAGLTFSLLVLLRYSFGIWALVIAVLMAIGLTRRGAQSDETEGTLVTFLAPLVYAIGVWILFNWLIVGDLFGWASNSGAFAVNASQPAGSGGVQILDVLERTGELSIGVFAIGIAVIPVLLFTAISRRDEMSWWLSMLAITGLVIMGGGALLQQDFNVLAMRNALPVLLVSMAGVAWLYRILPNLRTIIWLLSLVALALTAVGSWYEMQHYPFQGQEAAFVQAISTNASQEETNSIGGFRVGTRSEQQMATYINQHVRGRSTILADNAQTFGVILLSGRPELFLDRVDKGDGTFQSVVQRPYGRVRYMLIAKQVFGDRIRRRYPTVAAREAAGLTTVTETERYVLLSVAARDPRRPVTTTPRGGATPRGSAGTGGRTNTTTTTTGAGSTP
jgi:hypothetical protein